MCDVNIENVENIENSWSIEKDEIVENIQEEQKL
jgi:hypothetical protein